MSFCSNCGAKIEDNFKGCTTCGLAVTESEENIKTGGKFKKIFSGLHNSVKDAGKLLAVSFKTGGIIKKYVQALTDEQMDMLLSFYILDFPIGKNEDKVGIYDFFMNITDRKYIDTFIEQSKALNKDDVIAFYNSSLLNLREEICAVECFEEFLTEENASKMYKELLDSACEEVRLRLEKQFGGGKKDSYQLISEIGIENFYMPRYMFFHAISCQFFSWRKFMQNFDENTIAGVRQYLLRELAKEMTTDVERKENVQLKNGISVCIWRKQNSLCMLALDCNSIVSIKQRNEMKELAYREIQLEDILYFKVKGEYHRDQKITGGGTNVFLSQSTISKGNYTNEIKSETVVTDTRYVVLHMKEKDYNFTYNSLDGFKEIIPEKDEDIVSEIKKQNIIGAVNSAEIQCEGENKVGAADTAVDEILKFKQLFDSGILTQEEFEAKKKQILGI